jgi:hypothetical protein
MAYGIRNAAFLFCLDYALKNILPFKGEFGKGMD